MPDELKVTRLSRPEGLAVARITGTAENCTLHLGQTPNEALQRIAAELAPLDPARHQLVLSHAAATYIEGDHQYQADCLAILGRSGADLNLALRIAIHRASLPNWIPTDEARRARLLGLGQSQPEPPG
ncbi:hypothetical protein Drose_06090 [Dactylosporangium roseum]|uniref:Uncharacterized protein n=1 Tax=Dactylosporangium roseum TaxID=47989 RepID=A0ABY5ZAK8_9ACTN|nr:hypothetical protein [Dactylosporangium roseum]UWZ37842.1 hypothetical protein Drose_06090 [Dactylosporangium roseum]